MITSHLTDNAPAPCQNHMKINRQWKKDLQGRNHHSTALYGNGNL